MNNGKNLLVWVFCQTWVAIKLTISSFYGETLYRVVNSHFYCGWNMSL